MMSSGALVMVLRNKRNSDSIRENIFNVFSETYLGLMLYSVRSLLELSDLSDDVGYLKKIMNCS